MGTTTNLDEVRARHANRDLQNCPFFINERNWSVFVMVVRSKNSLAEVGREFGFSAERVRQIVHDVDFQLGLARKSPREWQQVTANSPIEDLGISVRVVHRLKELGCQTVEDLLRLDFTRLSIGVASRNEILGALEKNGYSTSGARPREVERIFDQLRKLRNRIDEDFRVWTNRVATIETRIRQLSKAGEKV